MEEELGKRRVGDCHAESVRQIRRKGNEKDGKRGEGFELIVTYNENSTLS